MTLFSLLGLALAGCSSTPDESPAVDHWLGDNPHLAITGTFQDKTFDVHLEGDAAAGVRCQRFYAPLPGTEPDADGKYDTSQLYFVMKEIVADIDLGGEKKTFSISYWAHDVPAGTKLEVIPRTFGTSIPEGKTWSDINLFDPDTDQLAGVESAAASGTVSMELNTGTPDSGGIQVPPGGRTGEFITASWGPRDNLQISATADCTLSIVATWAQSVLLP